MKPNITSEKYKSLRRLIRDWAKDTDAFVSDWGIAQWSSELEDRPESVEKIQIHIRYLIKLNTKPDLFKLTRSLEDGLPRDYRDRIEPILINGEDRTKGTEFFRMVWSAMQQSTPSKRWEKLRKCVDFGMVHAPQAEWTLARIECDEKSNTKKSD